MGYSYFCNMGFSCKTNDEKQIKRLLEIIGVDFNALFDHGSAINSEYFYEAYMGRNNTTLDMDEIFAVLNEIFEDFILLKEYEDYNSICDRHSRHEEIYDSKANKIYIGDREYCYGDKTVFRQNVYDVIKDECERMAKERNVPIKWEDRFQDGKLYPGGDDFYDLCEEILENNGYLEGVGQKTEIRKIKKVKIKKKTLKEIMDKAARYGYEDVIQLLNVSFDLNYDPARPVFIEHKPNYVQNIFADEIEHHLEFWDSYPVEELVKPCDQEVLKIIKDGEYLQIKNIRKDDDSQYYKMDYYYDDKYFGTSTVPTDGIVGGALELKTSVMYHLDLPDEKYLWYYYRFLNLDYKSIKKYILSLFLDGVEKIEVIDEYKTGNPEKDFISLEAVKKINFKRKDSGDSFETYNYENKKRLIDIARRLGVNYIEYDIQE